MTIPKYLLARYLHIGLYLSLAISSLGCITIACAAHAQEQASPTLNAAPPEVRGELWTGALYSSKFRAGACISPQGEVHGVLILLLKNGKEDVYHFHGTKDIHGVLRLKHSSGHAFEGHFENATSIQGTVTTKNGFTIKLQGDRVQNALLNGATCRPF